MLFPFLRYISPTWYFHLPAERSLAYFPDYDLLSEAERNLIQWDKGYSLEGVARLDAAYQAWHKGFIGSDAKKGLDCSNIQPTLSDNYRFVRRYFHPLWSWYILLLRLLSFRNPIREIGAFFQQREVKRVSLYAQVYPHEEAFRQFESPLVAAAPKVSVIIPTLNRYTYLQDALHDLEQQDYPHFEVIVVDQSEPFHPEFYEQFHLDIQLIRQEEKALWLARNTAIQQSNAEYLLLYDDDSRTEQDWITQHLKCLDFFDADISSGVSISTVGAKVPSNYRFFRWSDQLDTGNVLIRRYVFEKIGLFDRQFEKQRQGDGEFGLRAYLTGFHNISNPLAPRLHLKVSEGGLRQMGSWDGFRPKSWLAPRPVPSVLYLVRKYFGNTAAMHTILTGVPTSLLPYRYKRNSKMMMAGIVLFLVILPFVFIQICRSWRISDKMLQVGAKISSLK